MYLLYMAVHRRHAERSHDFVCVVGGRRQADQSKGERLMGDLVSEGGVRQRGKISVSLVSRRNSSRLGTIETPFLDGGPQLAFVFG